MAGGFSVVISATDKVTASINKINKSLASISAPVKRLNASLGKLGDASGVTALAGGVGKLTSGMVGLARSTVAVVTPLGAITSAASVAGVYKLTESFGEFGSKLSFAAQNIGISVDSLHSLQGAARLSGSSAESAASGMLNLSQAITDAAGGRNLEALGYFRQLGIEIRGSNGALRSAKDVLPEVADSIAKIANPQLQRRVAAAFGLSDDMLPFLRRGSAGLREYEAEARKYGVINEAGARASNEMREAQTRLSLAVEGLGYSVAEKLSPVLSPMLTQLADWAAKKGPAIGAVVADIAQRFDSWVKGGGIDTLVAGFGRFVEVLGAAGKALAWILERLGFLNQPKFTLAQTERRNIIGAGPNGMRSEAAAEGFTTAHPVQTGIRSMDERLKSIMPNWMLPPGLRGNPQEARGSASAEQLNAAKQMRHRLMMQGWTSEQAAGIVGNIQRESSFNPAASGDNGQAYGIAQWHADRQAAFKAWSGHDIRGSSLEEQTDFIHHELTAGNERAAGDRLRGARSAGEAGSIVSQYYERPGDRYSEAQMRARLAGGWDNRLAGPYTPSSAPAAAAAGAPGQSGTVKVEIVNRNAQPGTSMKVSSTGGVQATAKVETVAMLSPH